MGSVSALELIEQKGKLIARQEAIVKLQAERDLTAEEDGEFENNGEEIAKLEAAIIKANRAEAVESLKAENNRLPARRTSPVLASSREKLTDRDFKLAFADWSIGKAPNAERLQRAAECGLPVGSNDIQCLQWDTSTNSHGAEYIATVWVPTLDAKLAAYCNLLEFVTVDKTEDGSPRWYLKIDDTGNTVRSTTEGANETGNDSETLDPVSSRVQSTVTKRTTDLVYFTSEELRDSVIKDLPGTLATMFGTRFGRKYGQLGTDCITTAATEACSLDGAGTLNPNELSVEKLYEMLNGLDPAYYDSPGMAIMMSQKTWHGWCIARDGDGRLLFPGINDQPVKRLAGYRVIINVHMASLEDNDLSDGDPIMIAGDFSKVYFRQVNDRSLVRDDTQLPRKDIVGYVMRESADFFFRGHAGCLVSCAAVSLSS